MAKKSTALVSIKDQIAKHAAMVAANEKEVAGNFIRIKNGEFVFGDDTLPQPLKVVIVGDRFENTYFDGVYDPNNILPPNCFSIGESQDKLAPHHDSPDKQSDDCFNCPHNQFGSKGNGKACRNMRRLAVVNADNLKAISQDSEVATLKVAPTSLGGFSGLFKKIAKAMQLPPWATVIELVTEQKGNYFVVKPALAGPIEDEGVLQDIFSIVESQVTTDILERSYDYSKVDTAAPVKKRKTIAKKTVAKRSKF